MPGKTRVGAAHPGQPGDRTLGFTHGLGWSAFRFLRSRRLAIVLLILLGLLAIVGAVLPQRDRLGPSEYGVWAQQNRGMASLAAMLSLDSLYSAWWFLGLFALLYANTLACAIAQLRSAFRRIVRAPAPANLLGRPALHLLAIRGDAEAAPACAAAVLRDRGYRVHRAAGGLLGRKGALAAWGSPLFHLGIVVVLTGAAIAGMLRFDGYLEVGEGQDFLEGRGSYLQESQGPLFERGVSLGPLVLSEGGHRNFALRLDSFTATTSNWAAGIPSDTVSDVTILEGDREVLRGTIRFNEPLEYRGLRVYPTANFGLAPVFQLQLPGGDQGSGMVNMAATGQGRYENSLYLPGTSYRVTLRAREGDSGVEVEVFERRLKVTAGRLEPGQSLEIDGATLTLRALRHWTGLRVASDPGIAILYLGFGLVILGLGVSFLIVRREIWVVAEERPEGRLLAIGGHTPRLKALFAAELEDLADALRGTLDERTPLGHRETTFSDSSPVRQVVGEERPAVLVGRG